MENYENKFISNEKNISENDDDDEDDNNLYDSYISTKLLEKNELIYLLSLNKELNEKILELSEEKCKNISNIDILTNKVNRLTIESHDYNDYKTRAKLKINYLNSTIKNNDFWNMFKHTFIIYFSIYIFYLNLNLFY